MVVIAPASTFGPSHFPTPPCTIRRYTLYILMLDWCSERRHARTRPEGILLCISGRSCRSPAVAQPPVLVLVFVVETITILVRAWKPDTIRYFRDTSFAYIYDIPAVGCSEPNRVWRNF